MSLEIEGLKLVNEKESGSCEGCYFYKEDSHNPTVCNYVECAEFENEYGVGKIVVVDIQDD